MTKNGIKLLIVDVTVLINHMLPCLKTTLQNNSLDNRDYLDSFVDYCIFRSISDVFLTPVTNTINSYSHELVYSQLKSTLHPMITTIVDFQQMRMFAGDEVKAITNGKNLFITNFVRYD